MPTSSEDIEKYYRALGHMTHCYSGVEFSLHHLLVRLTSIPYSDGVALFSGIRVDGAMSYIRRLYRARKKPLPELAENCFQQITLIAGARNVIIHHGSIFTAEGIIASDFARLMPDVEARFFNTSPETLDAMASDLSVIANALGSITGEQRFPPGVTDEASLRFLDDCYEKARNAAWQYKSG